MADVLEGFIPMGNMKNLRFEFSLKDSCEKIKLFGDVWMLYELTDFISLML
ncbi:Uncharacterised protein [Klebsiella pneumoniae]|nr:Uncharacterised protein [Klebsiella pneumoniae]SLP15170.1 Uncharacterised protein [Klebsiella pneumoniae]SLP16757.1 Uncharacterised protein [Klebsiella pneumoniae]SLP19528.1 Uncharacterised protein [Klebsiella pneumoniae]VFZ91097.1 Uncharacterised protein [Klebsiella pneumoniae]